MNNKIPQNFGLRPYTPSVAVAVAEFAKPLATAVEIWPSVDPWELPLYGTTPLPPLAKLI